MSSATLKEVAARAGVSYQTVSKIVNGQANFAPETEARVWQAVEALNYQTNVSARNLRTKSSNLIGYGWQQSPDGMPHPILNQFLNSAVRQAELNKFHVLAFLTEPDIETTKVLFRDLFMRKQVEGYILANTNEDDPRIKFLIEEGIPFSAFGRANDEWDFHWVDVDNRSGMRQVTRHLVESGHQRIALITWPEGSKAGTEREAGYFQALAAAGLEPASQYIQRGENSVRNGFGLMQRLLALPKKERPTAVACVTDDLAIGAMNAVASHGMQVGHDIAITGFDNLPMSEFLYPPLTTVQQPIAEAGHMTVELLLSQLDGRPVAQKGILLEPTLVLRQSSER